jgi:hypothetical protein
MVDHQLTNESESNDDDDDDDDNDEGWMVYVDDMD